MLGPERRIGHLLGGPFAPGLQDLGRGFRDHVHYSAASATGAAWAPRSNRPGRAPVGPPSR